MKINLEPYIKLLKSKDNEAFEVVYYATYKGVFALILSIVSRKDVAEELLQDSYIRMIEKIETYQPGRNFSAWLFQIAKNISYDYLRTIKKDYILTQQSIATYNEHPNDDKVQFDFQQYLNALSTMEREILVLRLVNQLTFAEISIIIEKPLGTIYSIYHQALKKMKKEYRKDSL